MRGRRRSWLSKHSFSFLCVNYHDVLEKNVEWLKVVSSKQKSNVLAKTIMMMKISAKVLLYHTESYNMNLDKNTDFFHVIALMRAINSIVPSTTTHEYGSQETRHKS